MGRQEGSEVRAFTPLLPPCWVPEWYRQGLHRGACIRILILGRTHCISGKLFTSLHLGFFIQFSFRLSPLAFGFH